ncbi:MAG: DNA polymerase IV [Desulfobacterales bacterium]|nr:DNA polymerase IV [Desulfobacterales bacterium]
MILHVDMDAFFASVEQLDQPELRGKCVIVGRSQRGVVTAASYEARKFGVHSAMPVFQARRACPCGIFVPPRIARYREVSGRIMALLATFSPLVEKVSIDEAFMDISGCQRLFGPPEVMARTLKARVRSEVGLACSVGIAPCKFLAKIASDLQKPDGLTLIAPDEMDAFIARLPIEKVPGVGKTTAPVLRKLGVRFLGDVNRLPEKALTGKLGAFGRRLIRLAGGLDDSPVTPTGAAHSVSTETTLATDTRDPALLRRHLLRQAEEVAGQLRTLGFRARTVTLRLKHSDFRQVSRQTTLGRPTQSGSTLFSAACTLLDAYELALPVRLVGVGASGLLAEGIPAQLSLFRETDTVPSEWDKADRALDAISAKFGKGSVRRASLVDKSEKEK